MVIDPAFDWSGENRPRHARTETIIYEAHVRGMRPPASGGPGASARDVRGHGVRSRSLRICHKFGVTAVELMPVHYFLQDRHLVDKGLSNYWGYNTLGFFAPEPGYSSKSNPAEVVQEFKSMVKALHKRRHRGDLGRGL